MSPLVPIFFGAIVAIVFSLFLWYMLARPKQWARFAEMENAFWVRRGLPIKWAEACKEFEQGRGFKLLVAFCILMAAVLIFIPFILHRHG